MSSFAKSKLKNMKWISPKKGFCVQTSYYRCLKKKSSIGHATKDKFLDHWSFLSDYYPANNILGGM